MSSGLTSFFQITAAGPVSGVTSFFQISEGAVITPPVAPALVTGASNGVTTAQVSWSYGGSGESGFDVQLESPTGSSNWVTASGGLNPTNPGVGSFNVTGLTGSTSYTPRVRTNKIGVASSAYMAGSAFVTDNAGGGEVPIPPLTANTTLVGALDPFTALLAMGSVVGYRGDSLTASGVTGNCLLALANLPAENAVLFRSELVSNSFGTGQLMFFANGQYVVDSMTPNGAYSFTFRWYKDGVAQSPLITLPVLVGPSGFLTVTADFDAFTAFLDLASSGGTIAVNASIDNFLGGISLGTGPSLSIAARLDPFVSLVPLGGFIAGPVPESLSISRQYRINPDVHVDAYSIARDYTLTWKKDPDSTLDYSLEWADWLADIPGDSIANMYATSTPGLYVVAQALRGTVTAIVVAGGTIGTPAYVTLRVATAQGRIEERTLTFFIDQR